MDEIMVHPINDAPLFLSVEDRPPLAKIIDITNLLVLKTNVAGCNNGGGKRGKFTVRRGHTMHFHLHLSLHRGNTKVRKVPSDFLHQIGRATADLNREAIEIEALCYQLRTHHGYELSDDALRIYKSNFQVRLSLESTRCREIKIVRPERKALPARN